jgi:RNA polymerase sigma factor (sigma-70 family)
MDDETIINLYWERSETAITETAMKYGRYCRAIAFNILSNNADAEECENDTYMAAWNTIPPTRPNKLLVFLGRLTRNIALDRYDYNKAKKRNGEFDAILSELEDFISDQYDVEAKYEAIELSKCISEFLRSIDAENRVIFLRRYWFSDSINDISKQFAMSESKVKSILFRIRKKLKKYLEKEGVIL